MTESPNTRDISAPLLRLAPPLEMKIAGAEHEGVISGHASIFAGQPGGGPDSFGDTIARGAYAASLAEHKAAGTMPIMAWSHDLTHIIGRWTEIREDDRGLFVRGKLNLESSAGREAFAHLKAKDLGGLSIGFRLPDDGFRLQPDGSRLLTSIDLVEVSIVALPAARAARVVEVKSIDSRQQLVDFLREGGLPVAAAKKITAGGWPLLSGEKDDAAVAELMRRMETATAEIKALQIKHYR